MHVVHSLCVYKNCMHFVQPHITYQTHQKSFLSSFASRMVLDLRMQRRIRKRSQHLPPTPILPQRNILLHLTFDRLPPSSPDTFRHSTPRETPLFETSQAGNNLLLKVFTLFISQILSPLYYSIHSKRQNSNRCSAPDLQPFQSSPTSP